MKKFIIIVMLIITMISPVRVRASSTSTLTPSQLQTAMNAFKSRLETEFPDYIKNGAYYTIIKHPDGYACYMNTSPYVFYTAYESPNLYMYPVLRMKVKSDYKAYMDINSDGTYKLNFSVWTGDTGEITLPFNEIVYTSYDIKRTNGTVIKKAIAYGDAWGNLDYNYGLEPKYEDIGYPLQFRYFLPGMYGQSITNAILIGNNIHDFQATWKNKDDTLGYKVQIEYKGKYKAKKSLFSSYQEVVSDYVLLDELNMADKHYQKDEVYVDLGINSPIYLNISEKLGYKPSTTSLKQLEGVMRIRYVNYKSDNTVVYGRWVSATINDSGNNVVVVDDEGNAVETPEYGNGTDYTGEDIDDDYWNKLSNSKSIITSILTGISSIVSGIGQVPQAISTLLVGFPSEIWTLITIGIGCMVCIGIFKTIRG